MSLIPITSKSHAVLSKDEIAAIEAGFGRKLKDIEEYKLKESVEKIVKAAYVAIGSGGNVSETELTMYTSQFYRELIANYSHFTIEQIKEAIRLGSLGKLERETKHISPRNLILWVTLWDEQVKREAIHKNNKANEVKTEKTEEEKQFWKQKQTEDIKKAYDYFWEHGKLPQLEDWYLVSMYEVLDKDRKLLTSEEMNTIWEEADQEVKSRALTQEDRIEKSKFRIQFEKTIHERKQTCARIKALELLFKEKITL